MSALKTIEFEDLDAGTSLVLVPGTPVYTEIEISDTLIGPADILIENTILVNQDALPVKNEIPSGLVNGSNATFTSANDFIPESVEVFTNGMKQNIITDYQTISTRTIQLTYSPLTSEKVTINYLKL